MKREDPEAFARTRDATALGRVGDPETDIGRAVAFLVGPDAGFITGTSIALDGGKSFVR